jgi:RNA polymerase sigma factor (sigma-70 family)
LEVSDHIDLQAARKSLSPREDRVITMLFDLDRPVAEVARALGVNHSRVSQIKSQALPKLRAQFGRAA